MPSYLIPLIALLGIGPQEGRSPVVLPPPPVQSEFDLVMEGGRIRSARATNAPIETVAKRLAEAFKAPVRVSPESAKTRVTFAEVKHATLNELLLRITPSPFVETEEVWGADPKLVGVLLGGSLSQPSYNQPDAPGGMLVEGHTDEDLVGEDEDPEAPRPEKAGRPTSPSPSPTPAEPEGPFLRVEKDPSGRISLRGREQGLGTVLFQVAQAYRVRFDMRISEAPLLGEILVTAALPSDLPGILGQGVGLVVRRNIATGEEVPLRFSLDSPDSIL